MSMIRGGIYCLLLFLTSVSIWPHAGAQNGPTSATAVAASSEDPNKRPSEFNHHVAGYALIGIGLLVVVSRLSPRLRSLQLVWPVLFFLTGLFLALWSDAEIWPRGNLSWAWLLSHDLEARQHKVFAILLMAMGVVEYLRARDHLGFFLRRWSFFILAVLGAGLLLLHDHSRGSKYTPSERRPYLVNPALDQDGKPWPAAVPGLAPSATASALPADLGIEPAPSQPTVEQHANHDAMDPDAPMTTAPPSGSSMGHSMLEVHPSNLPIDQPAGSHHPSAQTSGAEQHHHHMTPAMLVVEREHFWFMLVGLSVALFKLISDSDVWRRNFVPHLWPSAIILLGVLLALYHE